jgi:hypothetical protein
MRAPNTQRLMQQLLRARLSLDDFTEAREYLEKLEANEDEVTRRGLLTAAIVAYCRPFTNSDEGVGGDATSQLSVSISKLFTEVEQRLHAQVLSLRHEVVAHTAYDRKPVKRLEGALSGFTMSGKLFDLLSEKIDISLFQMMCGALCGHCFTKMMELNQSVVEAENEP